MDLRETISLLMKLIPLTLHPSGNEEAICNYLTTFLLYGELIPPSFLLSKVAHLFMHILKERSLVQLFYQDTLIQLPLLVTGLAHLSLLSRKAEGYTA